jgi:hypothetical protein
VKCIYDEDYITLWKEIEDVTGGWIDFHVYGSTESNL